MSCMATDEAMAQMGYVLSDLTLASVSVAAAIGFMLYGGRLFLMLQRFPIESRGRRKKLQEVGLVTSICAGCFSVRCASRGCLIESLWGLGALLYTILRFTNLWFGGISASQFLMVSHSVSHLIHRAVFVALSAFDRTDLELDVMGHPLLNVLYYSLVEVLPSACVLFILRKLPPKRTTQQGYQQVRSCAMPASCINTVRAFWLYLINVPYLSQIPST